MIRASAPGSIMITGEHAVVYGSRAIVAAVEQRLTLDLRPRSDRRLRITSQIAEPFEGGLDDLPTGGPYKFVLAAVALYRGKMQAGVDLAISSAIDPTLGLGSSAAVTIAALGALAAFTGQTTDDLHGQALGIIRGIQGRGSGADLAASLHGGMIAYCSPPKGEIRTLPAPPPLSLCYCGYKTPTATVLQKIAEDMRGREAEYDRLYAEMGALADQSIAAAEAEDWVRFSDTLNSYQTLMQDLGVSDDTLNQIIASARKADVMAAKISGSGLGDCVLAVGPTPPGFEPVELAGKGLILHD